MDRPRRSGLSGRAWLIVTLLGALSTVCAWATHAPYFSICKVIVQGNHLTPTSSILQAAHIQPGGNIFLVSSRTVRRRVDALPAVQDVRIERRFPRVVVIKVRERRPWAVVGAGESYYLVDRENRVIGRSGREAPGLPEVSIASAARSEAPCAGSVIQSGPVAAALGCLRQTQAASPGMNISRIYIDEKRDVWLNINSFGRALLGRPEDLGAKLALLQVIDRQSSPTFKDARFVDLSNPAAPAYMPAPQQPVSDLETGSSP